MGPQQSPEHPRPSSKRPNTPDHHPNALEPNHQSLDQKVTHALRRLSSCAWRSRRRPGSWAFCRLCPLFSFFLSPFELVRHRRDFGDFLLLQKTCQPQLDLPQHQTWAPLQRNERLFKDYWDKQEGGDGKGAGKRESSNCKLDSDVAVASQMIEECTGEKVEPGPGGGGEDELRTWVEGWMTGELLFSRLSLQEGMSVLLAVVNGKGSDELLR